MKKTDILGVKFNDLNIDEAAKVIINAIEHKEKFRVYTPNPEIVMDAYNNPDFMDLINRAELVLPDGIGVVIASKILNGSIKERASGYDTIIRFFEKARHRKIKVFFLGAAPGVAQKAKERMENKYLGLRVVGVHDGYFKDEEKVIKQINDSGAEIVLVGLGSPKQEKFIDSNYERLNASAFIGCGGSFDVMSGMLKRAPDLFIKLHLEWLYRLLKQPSRFKRTLKLPLFLLKVISKRISG